MCAKPARVVDFQIETRERRVELAAWAGKLLADILVRLAGPRTPGPRPRRTPAG
jgi:hypothetical protein